jgi:hypothetical protein
MNLELQTMIFMHILKELCVYVCVFAHACVHVLYKLLHALHVLMIPKYLFLVYAIYTSTIFLFWCFIRHCADMGPGSKPHRHHLRQMGVDSEHTHKVKPIKATRSNTLFIQITKHNKTWCRFLHFCQPSSSFAPLFVELWKLTVWKLLYLSYPSHTLQFTVARVSFLQILS